MTLLPLLLLLTLTATLEVQEGRQAQQYRYHFPIAFTGVTQHNTRQASLVGNMSLLWERHYVYELRAVLTLLTGFSCI